jgi:hypothetical protein
LKRHTSVLVLILLLSCFFSISNVTSARDLVAASSHKATSVSDYENVTTHEGDLIIDGSQTCIIENCTYIQTGNVYLRDQAVLSITGSIFEVEQEYELEYEIFIVDYASLAIVESSLSSRLNLGINLNDRARVNVADSTQEGFIVCYGESQATISNSTVHAIEVGETSRTTIESSRIESMCLNFQPSNIVDLNNLKPYHCEYWNLHSQKSQNVPFELTIVNSTIESWALVIVSGATVSVSDSTIRIAWLAYPDSTAEIKNVRPGFFENYTLNGLTFTNSSVSGFMLSLGRSSFVGQSITQISLPEGDCNISIIETTIQFMHVRSFNGILLLDNATCAGMLLVNSHFTIYGNLTLAASHIQNWVSSNATRNCNIVTRDTQNDTRENARLTLYDRNYTVVWNGTTDSFGQADFNVTFSDNNYTDTLRLEALEGNYSAAMNVGFLSDTPMVLRMHHFADLNADGTINILDISIVAYAFGSIQRDWNWNDHADLDKNGIINIIDITMVAKDYGRTV